MAGELRNALGSADAKGKSRMSDWRVRGICHAYLQMKGKPSVKEKRA